MTEYKTSTTDTQFSIELITTFLQATHAAVGCYAAPLSALTESVSKRSRIHDTILDKKKAIHFVILEKTVEACCQEIVVPKD